MSEIRIDGKAFPAAPRDKAGWPWVLSSSDSSSVAPAEKLPRITVVIPTFRMGQHIEACLRSVLLQGYSNIEIIVMDGGSKDDTVEILKKYEPWITHWESEKDRGQSHAINKGFARATGEIVNWLCSDDLLAPGALAAVGRAMGDGSLDFVIGKGEMVFPDDAGRNEIMWPTEEEVRRTSIANRISQPSCFYRRKLLDRETAVRENLFYTMDQELWCYFLSKGAKWALMPEVLSIAVQDGSNKTRTADYRYYMESDLIFRQYWKNGGKGPTPRWYRMGVRPWAIFLEKHPTGMRAGFARWWIRRVAGMQRWWRRGRKS